MKIALESSEAGVGNLFDSESQESKILKNLFQ